MAMNVSKMVVQFLADTTGFKTEMKAVEAQVATFGTNLQSTIAQSNNAFTQVGGSMQKIGASMSTLGAGLTKYVTIPLGLTAIAAHKVGIEFETAFAGVRKTIDEDVNTSFDVLKDKILEIGGATGVSLENVAQIMQMAGQLGIRGNEALGNFTDTVAKLGIATGMSTDQLALMLGKFSAIYGLDVEKDIGKLAASITHLGNTTAANESDILRFGVRIAAVGKLSNISASDVMALAAASEASGTKAERGGTAITKIFLAIQREAFGAKTAVGMFSNQVTDNSVELRKWEKELEAAKQAQASLGTNATSAEMKAYSDRIATAQENIAVLTENTNLLKESMKSTGDASMTFAKFLGVTSAEFTNMYRETDGAMNIFEKFLGKITETTKSEGDVQGIMKSLGLSDARLIQAVLSLAAANETLVDSNGNVIRSTSSLSEARKNALEAFRDGQDNALNVETQKKLDTVSGQWGMLTEKIKSLAVIFTSDTNSGIKNFLEMLNTLLGSIVVKLQGMSDEEIGAFTGNIMKLIALGPGLMLLGKTISGVGVAFSAMGATAGMFGKGADGFLFDPSTVKGLAAKNALIQKNTDLQENALYKLGQGYSVVKTKAKEAADQASRVVQSAPSTFNKLTTRRGVDFINGSDGSVPQYRDKAGRFRKPRFLDGFTNMGSNMKTNTASAGATAMAGMKAKAGVANASLMNAVANPQAAMGAMFAKLATMATPLLSVVGKIAIALGGWAIVLALVTVAFTAFFVTTGALASEVKAKFDGFAEGIINFGNNTSTLLDTFLANFLDFASKVGEMFPTVLRGIATVLSSAVTVFWQLIPQIFSVGVTMIVTLIEGFVSALPNLLTVIINLVLQFVGGFLDNLPQILETGMKLIGALAQGIADAVPILLLGAIDLMARLMALLWEKFQDGTLWEIGKTIVMGLINGIIGAIGLLFQVAIDLALGLIDMIAEWLGFSDGSYSTKMYEAGIGLIVGLWEGMLSLHAWLQEKTSEIGDWLLGVFVNSVVWLYKAGKTILTGLWNGISWYYTNQFKIAFAIGKWILDAFVGAGSWLWKAGGDVLTGFLNGVLSVGSNIGQWFEKHVGGKFVKSIKDFFGIKSPSRLMASLGGYIGEGLVVGMQDSTKDVLKAAEEMTEASMIDPKTLDRAMSIEGGTLKHDYSGLALAFMDAIKEVGIAVYLDGREVTAGINPHLAMAQRRGR